MDRKAILLCCVSLSGLTAAVDSLAAPEDDPVLSQDLHSARIPGKVATVLWTVRPERCTLQVVFPGGTRVPLDRKRAPHPEVQVWLLKQDGTVIPSSGRAEHAAPSGAKQPENVRSAEILFAYPRSAAREAVAVAMSVDGVFRIEQIKPFGPSDD